MGSADPDGAFQGTWQFMSFGLLQDPYKRHTARGDLESFFWVVLYYGLHYSSHSFTKNVLAIMADIFDKLTFTHPDGIARGGTTKVALVTANFYIGRFHRVPAPHQLRLPGCLPSEEMARPLRPHYP